MIRCMMLSVVVALAMAFAGTFGVTHAGERVFTDDGVAIKGYDPVAYFTEGRPVLGSAEHTHRWQNSTWHFASDEHRDAFASEPRRYAPRYGGFCAGAMARGWLAPIDPEAFAIIDGKLYLAFDHDGIEDFEANAERDVAKADANWEQLGQ